MKMSTQLIFGALIGAAFLLAACDQRPEPVASQAESAASSVAMSSSTPPDPSVPAADSVLRSPAAGTTTEAPGTRTNATLSGAQESNAMPMAGQVNDHSAPLAAAKGASAR
jgi:PBP1b-binding outer membrane lipoprotein LpoB